MALCMRRVRVRDRLLSGAALLLIETARRVGGVGRFTYWRRFADVDVGPKAGPADSMLFGIARATF